MLNKERKALIVTRKMLTVHQLSYAYLPETTNAGLRVWCRRIHGVEHRLGAASVAEWP